MKFFGNFLAKERKNRAESSRKLRLEALENRELLSADGITPLVTTASTTDASQLIVTTLDDVVDPNDGVISLREAIATAVDNAAVADGNWWNPNTAYYTNTNVKFDPSLQGKITLNSPIDITFTRATRTITVDGVVGNNAKIEISGQFNITGYTNNYSSDTLDRVTFSNIAFVGDGSNVTDYVFHKSRVVILTVQNSIIQHYDLSVGVVSAENTARSAALLDSVESVRFINSVIYKNNFTTSQAQVVNTWYTADGTYRPTTGRHRIAFYNSTVTDNVCTATGDDVTYMFSVWTATNRTYVFDNSIVCTNKGFTYVIQAAETRNGSSRISLNNVILDYDPSPGYAQGDNWYQLTEDGRVRDKSENVIEGLEPIVFVEDSFLPDPNSITVDRGDYNLIPSGITTDIAGNPRRTGANVDIGAF